MKASTTLFLTNFFYCLGMSSLFGVALSAVSIELIWISPYFAGFSAAAFAIGGIFGLKHRKAP